MNSRVLACFFASSVSLLVTGSAGAQELIDYVVQPGDSCEVIAKKVFGDANRYDRLHDYNPELGPTPHHLRPGQILHLPKPGPDAKVTFVRNSVEAATPAPHPAHTNEDLSRGHKVSTLADSQAEVTFFDTTRIQLSEHTLVVILGSSASKTTYRSSAEDTTLLTGALRAHLGELAGTTKPATLPLKTPSGDVVLGGGEAKVSVDKKSTTRLAVYRGTSSIAAKGKKVDVKEGFGSKAEMGRIPTPPRPLPPPPVWANVPAALSFVDASSDAQAQLTGSFAAGPSSPALGAWHVQIAHDAAFRELIADAYPDVGITELSARKVPVGTYFVRVSAVDTDYFEGPFGPPQKLEVVAIEITAAGAGHGASLRAKAPLFCGVDGQPLAALADGLALAPGIDHEVRCATTADGTSTSALKVGADRLGAIRSALHEGAVEADSTGFRQRVTLEVLDAGGAKVANLPVSATADGGAKIVEDKPTVVDGVYVVTAWWPKGTTGAKVHFAIAGKVVGEGTLRAPEPSAESAKPTPVPDVRRRGAHLEADVALVGAFPGDPLGGGFGARLGGAYALPLGPGELSFGLYAAAAEHAFGPHQLVPCAASALACATGQATFDRKISAFTLDVGIPVRYRLQLAGALGAQLMVAPLVSWASVDEEVLASFYGAGYERPAMSSTSQSTRFGVVIAPSLYVDFDRRWSLGLEGGYRWVASYASSSQEVSAAGPFFDLHLRAAF